LKFLFVLFVPFVANLFLSYGFGAGGGNVRASTTD
jgi:hypothetical protein